MAPPSKYGGTIVRGGYEWVCDAACSQITLDVIVTAGDDDEIPEYSEDSESDEGSTEVLVVGDAEPDVVGHDSDEVNDRHDSSGVLAASRRCVQPQQVLGTCTCSHPSAHLSSTPEQVLGGEDEHTGGVEAEEGVCVSFSTRQTDASRRHQSTADRLRDVRQH